MRALLYALLLCTSVLAGATGALAQTPNTDIHGRVEGLSLGERLEVLEDASSRLTLRDVASEKANFRPSPGSVPNFGFSRATYWFRTRIHNRLGKGVQLVVEIRYPILDQVDFYTLDEAGHVTSRAHTGNLRAWETRMLGHRHFVFPFELAPGESTTVYLRVRSNAAVQLPVRLWTQGAFMEHDQWDAITQGVYAGFMLVMMLYNFFLYFSVRERMYLLYVPMVAGQLVFQFVLHGLAFAALWPSLHELNRVVPPMIIPIVTWAANAFAAEFLDVGRRDPSWARVMRTVRIACLADFVIAPFLPFDFGIAAGCVLAAVATTTVMIALLRLLRVTPRPVIIFGVAWAPLLVGTLVLVAEKFAWLSRGFLSENLVQMGSAFEVVVLSLALGDRINKERNEKLKAQELALEHERAAQRAQQEALLVQRRANETLEQRVKERTHALAEANARLAEASTIDALTGLRNRRYFNERFHDEFARGMREALPISVLMVDVDHFKQINDNYGHMVGDRCLVAIADVLRAVISRTTDTVARYGGEEFVIVLPNTDPEGARIVAEAVRREVEALTIEADGELIRLSVSVGALSRVPTRGERREAFLSRADGALYEAKLRGRNRVHVLEPQAALS